VTIAATNEAAGSSDYAPRLAAHAAAAEPFARTRVKVLEWQLRWLARPSCARIGVDSLLWRLGA
jgi:hypothetical protein